MSGRMFGLVPQFAAKTTAKPCSRPSSTLPNIPVCSPKINFCPILESGILGYILLPVPAASSILVRRSRI